MSFTFADLFAGIGGFHAALAHAGGECVFVSEIDQRAAAVYRSQWLNESTDDTWVNEAGNPVWVNNDIGDATPPTGDLIGVPDHIDVLTAGFPCQPFSKSGYQEGMNEARGTLFWNIARVLQERQPSVILLENVRNLVGPRHTHEWRLIIRELRNLGYRVSSKPSVFSPHFLPPSLGGTPQVRDRAFILGTFVGAGQAPDPHTVPPTLVRGPVNDWDPQQWDISWALDDEDEIVRLEDYDLSVTERGWIDFWDELIQELPEHKPGLQRLPGHPLWADHWVPLNTLHDIDLDNLPAWKRDFVLKNARYYEANSDVINLWKQDKRYTQLPASRRKLEWQAQDETSLWDTVMHFRPSGIRCKRPTYLPALVAITQTSIIGPRQRRLTPHEAARLQGLSRSFSFGGQSDSASYRQVGNGVCVGAAWYALRQHIKQDQSGQADIPLHIAQAILDAPANPSPDALSASAYAHESERLLPREAGPQPVAAQRRY